MSNQPIRRPHPVPAPAPKVVEYPAVTKAAEPAPIEYASFSEIGSMLWRRRMLVVAATLAGMVISLIAAYSQPRVYQARTSFEIHMPNEDFLNRRQFDPNVESGLLILEPFLQTQLRLLQSDTLLLAAAAKTGVAAHPEFLPKPSLLRRLLPSRAPAELTRGLLLDAIHKRFTVRLATQTQVVEVLFQSIDPKLAAAFANAVASEYKTQSLERRVNATAQTGALLSGQIAGLEAGLRSAERELEDFVTANGLVAGAERDSVAEARLRQLQSMLTVATHQRVADQSRYQATAAHNAEAVTDILESETLKSLRVKLTDLRQRLAEANQIYKPGHYKVQQIQAEIEEVQRSLARERDGILARQQAQAQASAVREQALQRDYESQARLAFSQAAKAVRYNTLKNQVETQRQIYDATLRRVKEAEVASAMQASNVQPIDLAVPPEVPFKPNKPFYLALGTALGAFTGVLLAFTRDRRLGAPVAELHGRPELTPHAAPPRIVNSPSRREPMLWYPGHAVEPSESFRTVLDALLAAVAATDSAPVVLLTSACGNEGRTTMVCNLGIAVAETGRRVLLIDADRFNPRLHEIFEASLEPGFADLLSSRGMAAPLGFVSSTAVAGLQLMPCGAAFERLPGLLESPRVQESLNRLRRHFDLILVDSPPVLSAPETRRLAALSDGVVMTVRGERTARYLVKAAFDLLESQGASVIGTVSNT